MSPRLSREASTFLDEVRGAEEPTNEDEVRVKRALDASVAAGVTCHWVRYPVRGDAAAPPAADLGGAGATVAKTSAVVWAAPLSVVTLCAAAWFATTLLEQGDEDPVVPHATMAAPAPAPGVAPSASQGTAPDAADQQGRRPAAARKADASARPSRARAPQRPKSARRPESVQHPESSGLGAELALLQRAQAALRRGDGAGALRELETFPDGSGLLLAERRVARVLALCSLSRVAEAQALAAEVVRTDPGSVQRAALQRSCANPSRNRGR